MSQLELSADGIDVHTGNYAYPPLDWKKISPESMAATVRTRGSRNEYLAVRDGFDERDIGACGWNIIFPANMSQSTREDIFQALEPLREKRCSPGPYREEPLLYQRGESGSGFLERHKVGRGPINPELFPYYLLIVGDAREIPFQFQLDLGMENAVGRLDFSHQGVHDLGQYRNYALRLAEEESTAASSNASQNRMAIFSPCHENDLATLAIGYHLLPGMTEYLTKTFPDWSIESYLAAEASKARLKSLFLDSGPIDLLFTAGHGLAAKGHPNQTEIQGALVCQEHTPGSGPISNGALFSSRDLSGPEAPQPRVAFHFACHGGGSMTHDLYRQSSPQKIADHPFLASLPQKALAHPKSRTLAVIGHIGRAWSASFAWKNGIVQRDMFESVFLKLLRGYPVGAAMEPFRQRFAAFCKERLEHELTAMTRSQISHRRYRPRQICFENRLDKQRELRDKAKERYYMLWTSALDARNYALLGDPAVQLRS